VTEANDREVVEMVDLPLPLNELGTKKKYFSASVGFPDELFTYGKQFYVKQWSDEIESTFTVNEAQPNNQCLTVSPSSDGGCIR